MEDLRRLVMGVVLCGCSAPRVEPPRAVPEEAATTADDDLVPGDIVAWLKPADVSSKNTGHVMIVREPVSVAHDEIAVPVIDSTSVRHGSSDSRYATKSTGLGTGTIYLVVDASGSPYGYRWSHGKKAREHATTIVLARVE